MRAPWDDATFALLCTPWPYVPSFEGGLKERGGAFLKALRLDRLSILRERMERGEANVAQETGGERVFRKLVSEAAGLKGGTRTSLLPSFRPPILSSPKVSPRNFKGERLRSFE